MNYQWYPGHMTKARRMMQEDMKLIDLVLELIDARIPLSSRNPDIDELARGKARIVLLNKADLADDRVNAAWAEYFQARGCFTARVDSRSGAGLKVIQPLIQEACREKLERDQRRGIQNRPVRAMVAGIPNVGKSTFINTFAGRACAKTGNKPGVTKGKQWIRLNRQVELLDTPGILWPKFEDQEVGRKLAVIGSIREELLDPEELALWLVHFLRERYPDCLAQRYGIAEAEGVKTQRREAAELEDIQMQRCETKEAEGDLAVLREIAVRRSCRLRGNELDLPRASALLIDDFRSGRLGRISLEFPSSVIQSA